MRKIEDPGGSFDIWVTRVLEKEQKSGETKFVFKETNKEHKKLSQNWKQRVSKVIWKMNKEVPHQYKSLRNFMVKRKERSYFWKLENNNVTNPFKM